MSPGAAEGFYHGVTGEAQKKNIVFKNTSKFFLIILYFILFIYLFLSEFFQ